MYLKIQPVILRNLPSIGVIQLSLKDAERQIQTQWTAEDLILIICRNFLLQEAVLPEGYWAKRQQDLCDVFMQNLQSLRGNWKEERGQLSAEQPLAVCKARSQLWF